MTFEQKVEKLRGIVDKKIVIRCSKPSENADVVECINKIKDNDDYVRGDDEENICYGIESGCSTYDWCDVTWYSENGYQIIPYSEFFADDKVNKPIKDWTIGEIEEYCKQQDDCKLCPMYLKECYYDCLFSIVEGLNLKNWKIDEYFKINPSLTQSEIDILKAIKVLYPNFDKLVYNCDTDMFTGENDDDVNILRSRLPSLTVDKYKYIYLINDLLEGAK